MRLRLWRSRRRDATPTAPAGLEIRLERERYEPGEAVRGTVVGGSRGSDGEVTVALNLHERSTEYESVADSVLGEGGGTIPPGGTQSFAIELPEDAFPSHASLHGGLVWTVDATDGPDGRVVASRTIEVVVGG